jgi:hypothetical protein
MTRHLFYAVALALFIWLAVALSGATRQAGSDPIPPDPAIPEPPPIPSIPPGPDRLEVAALQRRVRVEHRRYLAAHRRVRVLTRVLQHRSSTREAIELACVTYGSCSTLWRRAGCETGGTYSPRALNQASGAAGLFQFLPSTWQTTPFAQFSVWSPYANALAAGWMEARGRGSEWVCR